MHVRDVHGKEHVILIGTYLVRNRIVFSPSSQSVEKKF